MAALPATLNWALDIDVTELTEIVVGAKQRPLLAIASGGSLTAAHLIANLHRRYAMQLADVATPLVAATTHLDPKVSTWLVSASGGNSDIVTCF